MNWFEEWFDENYVDLYAKRNLQEAHIQTKLILQNIPLTKKSYCLDVGCGFGRYTKLFYDLGYRITGIDISKFLITKGKKQYPQLDLQHISVEKFFKKKKFECVFSLFTSFGYYLTDEENLNFLKKIFDLIKPNGFFWLDFLNSENILNSPLYDSWEKSSQGKWYYQQRRIQKNRIKKIINVYDKNGNLEKTYLESVQLYSFVELKNLFTKVGFSIKKKFGNYQGGEFTKFSPRLILLGQKNYFE
jgi:SAM-dependent methyltransferase